MDSTPSSTGSEDLRQFLKQYSSIPNGFIDDLFSMHGDTTNQTDPVVDLDNVAKWLGVPKFRLLQTLRATKKI
jgi:hypothetical protein